MLSFDPLCHMRATSGINPCPTDTTRIRLWTLCQRYRIHAFCAVVGGFRATPIKTLELLAFIPPLDLYLTTHVAIYRQRAAQNGIDNLILSRCKAIRESLVPRTRVMPVPLTHLTHNQALPASWYDEWLKLPRAACERITKPTSLRKNVLVSKWTDRWRSTAPPPSSAILLPTPTRRILDLHRNLTKGQSSFHTQIISEKIGLRRFLTRARVPDIPSDICR